jgi:hypothetical protein
MADYTANAYGIGQSRKDGKSNTSAGVRVEKSTLPGKGKKCMRFVIAEGSEIMGGEIWVNEGTVIANADTFTITATTG